MSDDNARAFSAGSDARIQGKPKSANPYINDPNPYGALLRGWEDADTFWGRWSLRPVLPLPKVRAT